jgi:hypothetical protein
MNVKEALRHFAASAMPHPGALRWTLDQWSHASPELLSRLRAFSACRNRSRAAGLEASAILHLCGEKGEVGAYAPLCQLIAVDPAIDEWLGDGVTETLPGILVKVFDADVTALQQAIESPAGCEFARSSAMAALGYLVRAENVMSDRDMETYLRRIRSEMKPRRVSVIWMTWAETAANLGFVSLRDEVELLIRGGLISGGEFKVEDFDRQIEIVRRDASGLAGFESDFIRPLEDAMSALETLSAFDDGDSSPEVDLTSEEPRVIDLAAFPPAMRALRQAHRTRH